MGLAEHAPPRSRVTAVLCPPPHPDPFAPKGGEGIRWDLPKAQRLHSLSALRGGEGRGEVGLAELCAAAIEGHGGPESPPHPDPLRPPKVGGEGNSAGAQPPQVTTRRAGRAFTASRWYSDR